MQKKLLKSFAANVIPWLLILLSVILAFYFYWRFPDKVAIHWDVNGQPNGYASPFIAAFFSPVLLILLLLLFKWLPTIDPLKKNYTKFENIYQYLVITFLTFIVFLQIISGIAAINLATPVDVLVLTLIGVLFIILGILLPKIKKNWFLGIRTPWTLSDDAIWEQTHKIARYTFIAGGLLMIASATLSAQYKITVFATVVVLVVIIPAFYSFILSRK